MAEILIYIFFISLGLFAFFMFMFTIYLFFEHFYGLFFGKTLFIHFYRMRLTLSQSDRDFLTKNFFYYPKLSQKKQQNFDHRVANFLLKYKFVGKEDFNITQNAKLMVAATHVMLTFGFRKYLIEVFDKIILFPNIYYSSFSDDYHKGEFNVRMKAIAFSWFHFEEGYELGTSNLNLGIHEFTHAIHYYCQKSSDASAVIFNRFYNQIMDEIKLEQVKKKLIQSNYFRIYAFTNSFEFLAVLMEHYFETPEDFKKEFPSLFKKIGRMLNN